MLLEYKTENYVQAVNVANEGLSKNCIDDYRILLALSEKLNIYFNVDYEKINYNYSTMQLLEYDVISALDHINSRHNASEIKSDFNEDIDIYKLFKDIGN